MDNRRQLCNNKFVTLLMNINNWEIIKHWTEYEQNLIKTLPKEPWVGRVKI